MNNFDLLRVGGRLEHANINYNQKHSILLPHQHPLMKLILEHEHIKNPYAGPQLLLSIVRQNYWPIGGRSIAKNLVRKCIICFRARPVAIQPLMGDLPAERINPLRPFSYTGVHYCGPIKVRPSRKRGVRAKKAYIAIFVCFCAKVIHIELVGNLTTESSFLGALKKFISRRGKPLNIYSHNATNFAEANNELQKLQDLFEFELHKNAVVNHLSGDNITWHFITLKKNLWGTLLSQLII